MTEFSLPMCLLQRPWRSKLKSDVLHSSPFESLCQQTLHSGWFEQWRMHNLAPNDEDDSTYFMTS